MDSEPGCLSDYDCFAAANPPPCCRKSKKDGDHVASVLYNNAEDTGIAMNISSHVKVGAVAVIVSNNLKK